jgi:hypothetical protein
MAQRTLAELTQAAANSDGPVCPPKSGIGFGGVDPLGLRQLNFDLMDQVLPGLNNVARHIRPFVVVAWAWRRAVQLAESQGLKTISPDLLQDFIDRIEVLYVWSQLLKNENADLPGRQVLAGLVKASEWTFGGANWEARKKTRRDSTALSAPINYGPGLKMLGWVQRHPHYPDVMIPTDIATPALDAFEARIKRIKKHLGHPAFSAFGSVTVTKEEAKSWADDWSLDAVTSAEAKAMAGMLFGAAAPQHRQLAGEMILAAIDHASTTDANYLRGTMAGAPSDFVPAQRLQKTWVDFRRLQVRQLFRLSLEALFYWTLRILHDKPKSIEAVVGTFTGELPPVEEGMKAGEWLRAMLVSVNGPTELMTRIQEAMKSPAAKDLAPAIAAGLAFCLSEPADEQKGFERLDRLPLNRARKEAGVRADNTVGEFFQHVLESWILAQHVYWSVGRGLADARAQAQRTILRLRVILDEGGWRLTPGASPGSPPVPTADRLYTALTLARESRLLDEAAS